MLAGLDLDEAQRASVHTPAGLDIGARTPREVALSILAEIVSLRPRPTATPPVTETAPAALAARPATATDLVCGMTVVADDTDPAPRPRRRALLVLRQRLPPGSRRSRRTCPTGAAAADPAGGSADAADPGTVGR